MCGIAGVVTLDGSEISVSEVDRFVDSLAHRGPDGRGVWCDSISKLYLGHRRLAIIDTDTGGAQPMSDASGRYWVSFNGEIYNFIELRKELELLGYKFKTNSDTEVLLQSYAHWGEDCQLKFNGMWAFAIWDVYKKSLFLSRDRFGVKPLHYIVNKNIFAFASEMKAFQMLSMLDLQFDEFAVSLALGDYTSLESTEVCLLKGLKRLVSGHCLTFKLNSKELKIRRWWNTLDHIDQPSTKQGERINQFRELFFDATKIRARSDVPIATALSGGLDSSSVLAGLNEVMRHGGDSRSSASWRSAFIGDFPNSAQDETKYALDMAKYADVAPHIVTMSPNDPMENLENIIYQFEEVYDIPVALWSLYRNMSDSGIKVSIDGHGGDELLSGYHHYPKIAYHASAPLLGSNKESGEMKVIYEGMHSIRLSTPSLSQWNYKIREMTRRPKNIAVKIINKIRRDRRGPTAWLALHSRPQISPIYEQDCLRIEGLDPVTRQQYLDFHVTTLPTILRNFDRMSMGNGVEIRAPFLDFRLVSMGFSLPLADKLGGGYTKKILRDSMIGYMPENIRLRKEKLGFVFPLADWAGGRLRTFMLDMASSRQFMQSNIWNGSILKNDLEDAFKNKNGTLIRHAWPFLQAHVLIQQFEKHKLSIHN